MYQMQTESGGNPNAINLTDSNAAAGDPSRGLMQTIMTTFMAYHWPGTSYDIYNPLANIAAALNYADHVYGPTLMSGGMGIGSGHGYDTGGWLPPGLSVAYNGTGRPEQVIGPNGASGGVTSLEVTGGSSTFEKFMAEFIREFVRVKGGGSVQRAFGSRGK
jgi:SLT domain-containing protein